MGYDIVIRGGAVVDGTGAPAYNGDVAIVGDRIVAIESSIREPGRREIDADGRDRHARLRRHPHPPRRPAGVGPDRHVELLARRHERRARQLRRHVRAVPAGRPGVPRRDDGERRGHPPRRDPRRAAVGLGDVRRVLRLARPDAEGPQRRRPRRPLRAAHLRDGRARARHRAGDGRRHRRRWRRWSTRRWRPARSASRPAARSCTACPTAARCPARTPPPTSCSRSPTCSAAPARACSRARCASASATTSRSATRGPRWRGWARSAGAAAARSASG